MNIYFRKVFFIKLITKKYFEVILCIQNLNFFPELLKAQAFPSRKDKAVISNFFP